MGTSAVDIIERLQDKNDTAAHKLLLELEAQSAQSSELYGYYDRFVSLIHNKSSFVRTRGFRLCWAQAKWDTENRLDADIAELLTMLDDDKPSAVRQCLSALRTAILYKPDLVPVIERKLDALNTSKYKDSMRPLVEKDIAQLRAELV